MTTDWTETYITWKTQKEEQLHAQLKHDHTCRARVDGSGRFGCFNTHTCTKKAKFRRLVNTCNQLSGRNGFSEFDKIEYRWFCSIHDPVQIRDRQNKKDAERTAEYERNRAHEAVRATRQQLVDAIIGKLTNEQLIWLAARLNEDKDLQAELREVK